MDVITARVLVAILTGILTFICGLIPVKLKAVLGSRGGKARGRIDYLLPMLNAFAGGTLFATYFIHMIPEIRVKADLLVTDGRIRLEGFPFTELVVAIGFFAVYLVEEIVHYFACYHSTHQHHGSSDRNILTCTTDYDCDDRRPSGDHMDITSPLLGTSQSSTKFGAVEDASSGAAAPPAPCTDDHLLKSSVRSFILIIALSFHSVFEGIAIGMQSTVTATFILFGGVICHKLVLAFCIGIELVVANNKFRTLITYAALFSLMSPLGILLPLVNGPTNQGTVSELVLQGLAAGTLFYVTFFEVLRKERVTLETGAKSFGILTMFCVLTGFVTMSLFNLLDSDAQPVEEKP